MDYYSVKDVMEVTGASQTLAYEIIRKLRSTFHEEYPDAIEFPRLVICKFFIPFFWQTCAKDSLSFCWLFSISFGFCIFSIPLIKICYKL